LTETQLVVVLRELGWNVEKLAVECKSSSVQVSEIAGIALDAILWHNAYGLMIKISTSGL
jgi:transcriptional regulator